MTDARAAGLGRIPPPDAPLPAAEAPRPMYPALNTAPLSPDLAAILAGANPAATESENDNPTLPNAPPAEPTQRDADDEFGDMPPGVKSVLRSFIAAQVDGARSTEMLARVLSGMQQSPSPSADANSFANADGTRLPRLFDTTFTGAEIEKCLLTLDVETWAEELHAFEDYIRNKDTNLPAVFGMDDMQWAHATHPSNPAYKTLMAADAYAGRQISVCLDHKLPRVKRFLKEQRNPARSGAPTSARTMLAAIVVFQKPRTQGDLNKVKTRYETGVFFTVGMDVDEAQLAALRCVEAFESNPHRSVHPFAVQLALLDKLVASPDAATSHVIAAFADPPQALATIISNYRATILRCELDPEEDARSLAIVKMQSVLAYAVAATPAIVRPRHNRPPWGRKTAVPLSAFDASTATEQWCQDDDCTGCGECGSCESQPDLQADVASGACWDCGEQVPDAHPMRQCNKKCKECGLSFCPGNRGLKCVVVAKETITERSIVPNGAGMPLRGRALRAMISKQEEVRKRGAMQRGRAAAESAINAYATDLGVSVQSLDCLSADQLDQEVMLGGVLETSPPSAQTLALVRPPASLPAEPSALSAASPPPPDKPPGTLVRSKTASVKGTTIVDPPASATLGQWAWCLLDSGANCNISVLGNAKRFSSPDAYQPMTTSIGGQGKGHTTAVHGRTSLPLAFEHGHRFPDQGLSDVYDSPMSRKMILDQNTLYYTHGIKVDLTLKALVFSDGSTEPLYHRGDNRLWARVFLPVMDTTCAADPSLGIETTYGDPDKQGLEANSVSIDCAALELEASVASISTSATLLLLAARYNVSAQGLTNMTRCVDGMPEIKACPETRRLIDADVHRRASIQKRASAPKINPDRPTAPGHTIAFDGIGPWQTPSIIGGHTYSMLSTDVATGFADIEDTKRHRSSEWLSYAAKRFRTFRAWGHECFFGRFDRSGDFTSRELFVDKLEEQCNVTVQFAPSKWHEGVAVPEVTIDVITRSAECMLARVNLGQRYLAAARKQAVFLFNLKNRRGHETCRSQEATGVRPSAAKVKTYIFGCTVIVLRDKDDRGPKGSLHHGRTYVARYLCRDGAGHCVENLETRAICYPSHCSPINETELIRDSMPPSAALHSTITQTGNNDVVLQPPMPAMPLLPHVPAPSASPPDTPDGRDMMIMLIYGGHEHTIDNIRERILKRYPFAQVIIIDVKNDAADGDLLRRSTRRSVIARLQQGDITCVWIAQPCTTYGNCLGVQMRGTGKQDIWGLPGLEPRLAQLVKDHNILSNFSQEVMEFCDARDIPWGAECAPARDNPSLDTHWAEYAHYGTFWHHSRVLDLQKTGAKRYIVARCRTEDPPTAQKYYEIMLSKQLQPSGDELLLHRLCDHSSHPVKLRGKNADGYWISQQMEEYTPGMCDDLAVILTSPSIPAGASPAPTPPFSTEPRQPNVPVSGTIMPVPRPVAATVEQSIDDALLAYDGEWTPEFDAALAGLHVDSAAALDVAATTVDDGAQLSPPTQLELASLVTGLKLQDPRRTRQDIHTILASESVQCSLSQVKRVRVGECAAAERHAARNDLQESIHMSQQSYCAHMERRRTGERISAAATAHNLNASKASQQLIDVVTDVGTRVYAIPSNTKQVRVSPEAPYWIEADRSALQSILVGGNHLVRIDKVPKGVPIANCVTNRRLKVDQSSGELDKFKSRHAFDGNRFNAIRAKLGLPPPPTGTCNIIDDMAIKIMFGDLAQRHRYFAKCDIGDAYINGTRNRPAGYMRMPDTVREYDEDGTEMVVCFVTPIWGETEAGFEWDIELHETLLRIGWRQSPGVPAMYYFDSPTGDCRLVKIVDDIGFSESGADQTITKATIAALQERYNGKVTHDLNPTSFVGYKVDIARSDGTTTVQLSQERKVSEAARKYMPSLLEGVHPKDLLEGTALTDALSRLTLPADRSAKLNADQKRVQQIIGDLKYFERGIMPRISRMVHYLSCIMSFPPPGALPAAEGVLALAYKHRADSLTYRSGPLLKTRNVRDGRVEMHMSEGAPAELEVSADASNVIPAVYAILITLAGAAVLHQTKKIGGAVGSTYEAENVATIKASEHAVYARIVLFALGRARDIVGTATRLLTDNLSNQRVCQNANSAVATRSFLIRSTCLHQRITDGDLTVGHIPDPENPSDFLTKIIGATKTATSAAYASGALNAPPTQPAHDAASAELPIEIPPTLRLDAACADLDLSDVVCDTGANCGDVAPRAVRSARQRLMPRLDEVGGPRAGETDASLALQRKLVADIVAASARRDELLAQPDGSSNLTSIRAADEMIRSLCMRLSIARCAAPVAATDGSTEPPSPPPSPAGGDTYGTKRRGKASGWGRSDMASRERARKGRWDKMRRQFERKALAAPHPQECPVCMDDVCTHLLYPCGNTDPPFHRGHGVCGRCAFRLLQIDLTGPAHDARCPLCALPITGAINTGDSAFFVS